MLHPIVPGPSFLRLLLLVGALLSATGSGVLYAQSFDWERLAGGMEGATVWSIAFDRGGTPYIGTTSGIFKRIHDIELGFTEWLPADTTLISADLQRTSDGVMLARAHDGIYVEETDEYGAWKRIAEGSPRYMAAYTRHRFAWYDASTSRIYGTKDGGRNSRWNEFPEGIAWLLCDSIGTLYAVGEYRPRSPQSLWISTDFGETWTKRECPESIQLSYAEIAGRARLLMVYPDQLYRSEDRGATWDLPEPPPGDLARTCFGDDGILYGFVNDEEYEPLFRRFPLYYSTDTGSTWVRRGGYHALPYPYPRRYPFAVDRNGDIWEGAYRMIYNSTDGGLSWAEDVSGLSGVSVVDFLHDRVSGDFYTVVDRWEGLAANYDPHYRNELYRFDDGRDEWIRLRDSLTHVFGPDSLGNLYRIMTRPIVGVPFPVGIAQSRDRGATWQRVANVDNRNCVVRSASGGVVLLQENLESSTFERKTGELALSLNGGIPWLTRGRWLPEELGEVSDCFVMNDGTMLIAEFRVNSEETGTENHVWRYDPFSDRLEQINTYNILAFVEGPEGAIYAYGPNRLFRLYENADRWEELPLPSDRTVRSIYGLAVAPDHSLFMHYRGLSNRDTLYYSDSRGKRWRPVTVDVITSEYTGPSLLTRIPAKIGSNGMFIDTLRYNHVQPYNGLEPAQTMAGFFVGTVNGGDWKLRQVGPAGRDVTALLVTGEGKAYVGTRAHGVYRLRGTLSAPDEAEAVPRLRAEAVPIPASDRVDLFFDAGAAGSPVRIELFSILGEPVRGLHRPSVPGGRNRVSVDLEGLPSGAYVVRITTGNGSGSVPVIVR